MKILGQDSRWIPALPNTSKEIYTRAIIFFYYYLVYETIGTAATSDLFCQPRVIVKMIVEKQVKYKLAGETEILGENLPLRHFCPSQNPT
jgi:hypothetical protein